MARCFEELQRLQRRLHDELETQPCQVIRSHLRVLTGGLVSSALYFRAARLHRSIDAPSSL